TPDAARRCDASRRSSGRRSRSSELRSSGPLPDIDRMTVIQRGEHCPPSLVEPPNDSFPPGLRVGLRPELLEQPRVFQVRDSLPEPDFPRVPADIEGRPRPLPERPQGPMLIRPRPQRPDRPLLPLEVASGRL